MVVKPHNSIISVVGEIRLTNLPDEKYDFSHASLIVFKVKFTELPLLGIAKLSHRLNFPGQLNEYWPAAREE